MGGTSKGDLPPAPYKLAMGQVCLQGHLQLRDQFTGAVLGPHTLENLKVFQALDSFSKPDKISKFGLVGHAVVSLPSPPPPSTCQCSHPARCPSHASSCPVSSPVACVLPQTSVLPRRGSTPWDLEPWPDSGEASQILLSRGILAGTPVSQWVSEWVSQLVLKFSCFFFKIVLSHLM